MAASSLSKKFIFTSYFLIFLVLALFFVPTNAGRLSVKGLDAGLVIDGAKLFVETLKMALDKFLPKDKKE